jgi:hypothetical protein
MAGESKKSARPGGAHRRMHGKYASFVFEYISIVFLAKLPENSSSRFQLWWANSP